MEKVCIKCAPKTNPRLFQFWLIAQNSQCMQEALLKIRYCERGLSKNLDKVKLMFSFAPGNIL